MKHVDCSHCPKKDIPLNETIKIDGEVLCAKCFEVIYPTELKLQGKQIEKELDPTICAFCKKDNDTIDFPKIAHYPVCSDCSSDIKNRTLPTWVKGFFVFVMCTVAFSFYYNWRYFQSYEAIKGSHLAYGEGNIKEAKKLMTYAYEKVPEVDEINTMATFYSGIDYLTQDKNAEALTSFRECQGKMPGVPIDMFIAQAEIGESFDKKDYQRFLSASKILLQKDTSNANAWAAVASAYACIYADKGEETAKTAALEHLKKAQTLSNPNDTSMVEYSNRIEHRIFTKEIIESEEFSKRYPNGWTKPKN